MLGLAVASALLAVASANGWPARLSLALSEPQLADRAAVAAVLIRALNSQARYPEALSGGTAPQDELLAAGSLPRYPRAWIPPGGGADKPPDALDRRGRVRWRCAVSALESVGCMWTYPGEVGPDGTSPPWEPDSAYGCGAAAIPRVRCLGGMPPRADVGTAPVYNWDAQPRRQLNYFGYRSEPGGYGAAVDSAWLWFYGSNLWPAAQPRGKRLQPGGGPEYELFNNFALQPPRGLDLLNAVTGELCPDGIPDGICLLYALRDGQLVASVAAEYRDAATGAPQACISQPADSAYIVDTTAAQLQALDAQQLRAIPGEPLLLRARVRGPAQSQLCATLWGDPAQRVWFNDLGWPPDTTPGDGIWTALACCEYWRAGARELPLRLELRLGLRVLGRHELSIPVIPGAAPGYCPASAKLAYFPHNPVLPAATLYFAAIVPHTNNRPRLMVRFGEQCPVYVCLYPQRASLWQEGSIDDEVHAGQIAASLLPEGLELPVELVCATGHGLQPVPAMPLRDCWPGTGPPAGVPALLISAMPP